MEMQFHCPAQDKTVDETACRAFSGGGRHGVLGRLAGGRKECRRCKALAEFTAQSLCQSLEKQEALQGKVQCCGSRVRMELHQDLTASVSMRSLQEDATIHIDCGGLGSCRETVTGDEVADIFRRIAAGELVFVSKLHMDGKRVTPRQKELLLQRKELWSGMGVKVIDADGVCLLRDYGK